jgi:uncharacterized protein (TIGR03118 family)
MNRSVRSIQVLLVLGMLTLAIVALNAAPVYAKQADHDGYVQTNLVSDGAVPALNTDSNLKNPWGISFRPPSGMTAGSPFWISDNNGGVATLYDGTGAPSAALPLVTIPMPKGSPGGTPTGTVFNTFSNAFVITASTGSKPALFIFSTEDGTIVAWNAFIPEVDVPAENPGDEALVVKDNSDNGSATGAVYKGLALAADSHGNPHLYATNFRSGNVDVFDRTFAQVTLAGSFTDPKLPKGYAAFGIQLIGDALFVTYALQDQPKHDPVNKPGHGIVDIFDTDGNFMERFASHGHLDSPWGVTSAPSTFGVFANDILIGNFGDGKINAYDPMTRHFKGVLRDVNDKPIVNESLWALTFGGALNAPAGTLYFTAGLHQEMAGLFGPLTPQ